MCAELHTIPVDTSTWYQSIGFDPLLLPSPLRKHKTAENSLALLRHMSRLVAAHATVPSRMKLRLCHLARDAIFGRPTFWRHLRRTCLLPATLFMPCLAAFGAIWFCLPSTRPSFGSVWILLFLFG